MAHTNIKYDIKITEQLSKAWELILEQFSKHVIQTSQEEGSGISIFLMKPVTGSGANCNYFYAEYKGECWNDLMKTSPQGNEIDKLYDPDNSIAICVQLTDETGFTGNIRLFQPRDDSSFTLDEIVLGGYEIIKTSAPPHKTLRKRV